jgi:hypothetical protein
MHTCGGRVTTVIGGKVYSARGEIKLDVSNIETAVEANQDGSTYRTVKPRPRQAEITFDRFVDNNGVPLRWDEGVMMLTNLGVTFIEQDTNITHLLSNACFTGNPSANLATGELDGLKIAADKYTTIS